MNCGRQDGLQRELGRVEDDCVAILFHGASYGVATLAGCDLEVGIRQHFIQFAFMTGDAVRHGWRVGEFHGMRHVHIVHEGRLISILGLLLIGRAAFFASRKVRGPGFRIVGGNLPFEMAAFAIIQVTGFTSVEISCCIPIDLTIDVAMLEVWIRVTFLTTRVIGGRNIIGAFAGLSESRKWELNLFDAHGQATNLLVIALYNQQSIYSAFVNVINKGFVCGW